MMHCELIRDLLPLYHDGACSAASRAAVEAHIESCEACRALLAEMDAPLPLPENPPALSRMKEAKSRLVRRVAFTVLAAVTAMGLLAAGGAALYTEFEAVRPVRYSAALASGIACVGNEVYIPLQSLGRCDSVECVFRRVTIDGAPRDIACIAATQSWMRKYLDWSDSGPPRVALGAGTGLTVGGGALRHEVHYGYEYEPELWNPGWVYPGHLSAVYYWDSEHVGLDFYAGLEEELFMEELARCGVLLWEE